MDFSAALPTFVITLREGVEAALVWELFWLA